MDEPPAKRQRMTEDVQDADKDANAGQNSHTYPTTPTRRKSISYASPTKASLARSHPNVLAKSPGRNNTTESRGKMLRAELLAKRPNEAGSSGLFEPAAGSISSRSQAADKRQHEAIPESTNEKDGFASAIESALTNATDTPLQQQVQPRSVRRTPLSSRQSRSIFSASRRLSRVDDVVPDLIVPKLVERSDSLPGHSSRSQSTEPELPPTPVQLGISPAPDRPRGLFSSSSIGSRSESGRYRRRVRKGTSAVTSSPLKPRDRPSIPPPSSTEVPDLAPEIAHEAPESDMEEEPPEVDSVLAQEIEAKKATLSELKDNLDQYRQQTSKLETITDTLAKNDRAEIDESTINALLNEVSEFRTNTITVMSDDSTLPYLNLFAPGNLTLTHSTIPRRIRLRPQIIHKLTLTAPHPWPSDVLQISFDVLIDTEEERIGSIIQSRPGHFYKHKALQVWIEKRLEHPMHKHKISELVWGAGEYFDACVQRAKILKRLSQRYGNEVVYANEAGPTEKLTSREALVLCHYLDISEVTFSSRASEDALENPLAQRVLVTYDLNLSWTGNITHDIDISITGVNMKAEKGAKTLFNKLLAHGDVVSALDSVWSLLEFGPDNTGNLLAEKKNEHTKTSGRAIPAV